MKFIDCTLREGGYYNNWNFSKELIQEYIYAISASGIEIAELGFRKLPEEKTLGDCAYTTERFINSLDIPDNLSIAVMINAKDIPASETSPEKILDKLFKHKSESKIEYVRIAVNAQEALKTGAIIKHIHRLGYKVCLNLMQINTVNTETLTETVLKLNDFKEIEVLYFADTFGNLSEYNVKSIISTIRSNCSHNIGFHAHNNRNLALSNTIYAINAGCRTDGTVTGIGRGAGNVQTEYLLKELFQNNIIKVLNEEPIKNLIYKYFQPLKDHHKWGHNIYYHLGAISNIHPSYIQQMISTKNYSSENILNKISLLSENTDKNIFVSDSSF